MEHVSGVSVGVGSLGQVAHFTGVPGLEPLDKPVDPRWRHRRSGSDQIEAEVDGFVF